MAELSPEEVGFHFVQAYYSKLNEQPEKLYQFYTKASIMIHGAEGDASTELARGQSEISTAVRKEGYKDCKVLVCNVDCLPSSENGVLVQVIGEIANDNRIPQKFVQTFFLAKQPKGYFVLNDILRIIKEDIYEPEESPALKPDPERQPYIPAAPGTSVPEHTTPSPGPMHIPVPIPSISQPGQTIPLAHVPAIAQPSVQGPPPSLPPHLAAHGPIPSAQPALSWAQMVGQSQKPVSPPVPSVQTSTDGSITGNTVGTPASATPAGTQKPSHQRTKSENGRKKEWSAFIGKVTDKVDAAKLEYQLQQFGAITRLKLEPERGRGFADFADQSAYKRALEAGNVSVEGLTLTIEERKRQQSSRNKQKQ